ncbi:glycogen/starch/alpha-glucan phosphorylase [Gemmata sp.]|uniref:glycogen/starch/alpha-glucan phosphorylase n=1 Tax=Gemmata sp. TaxID=1914242 RepID=UPI003F7101B6
MAAPSSDSLSRYECAGFRFPDRDYYDRHLVFGHVAARDAATQRERFEAVARTLRDVLAQRWIKTNDTYDRKNPKQVYYLSMEFLIGRSLVNNIVNLGVEQFVREELRSDPRQDWKEVLETEPDAGLGNGGLGRLAACFIDSLATLEVPAIGYGLRYDYGIFRQELKDGRQVEQPDPWLSRPDPWEVVRPGETVTVPFACRFEVHGGQVAPRRGSGSTMLGVPYDRPVVGYGGRTINTLRLWKAGAASEFNFGEFSSGDFFGAVSDRVLAESVTRVLYPDDSTPRGRSLRFVQEYFLVRCSLADIVARFRRRGNDWAALPDKVAVQLNDTHPAMAVPELMRILLDEAGLGWDEAWDLTVRTLAYTNHTLLPEALEKWGADLFEALLPRHLEIVYEINRRFLDVVRAKHPGDDAKLARVSLVEEGAERKVRMAHLAIVGTHSTNGVAAIHSELLRTKTVPDFAELFPDRFNNKTNGVTPRRWLLTANPDLARLLTEAVGDGWVTDLSRLRKADPLANDAGFRDRFLAAKRGAKARFVDWIGATAGIALDPDTLFDVQIKRIHEYKRQLLNAVQCVVWYNRLRQNPGLDVPPRTVLFAGKAAPAYHLAKVIIMLITSIGRVVGADPAVRGKLRVEFLPNYSCTLAEHLIPAADVSEQISTAGYEASGTSNMKLMMNGALTVGTRDGANIEIAEEAGEGNVFLFGLTAEQVLGGRGWYDPRWHYENEPETRAALDLIFNNHFSPDEPGIFEPLRETLLTRGDYYMHLADLTAYVQTQQMVAAVYRDPQAWAAKAIHNVARSGKFSSDRTVFEYLRDVWTAGPCPIG